MKKAKKDYSWILGLILCIFIVGALGVATYTVLIPDRSPTETYTKAEVLKVCTKTCTMYDPNANICGAICSIELILVK